MVKTLDALFRFLTWLILSVTLAACSAEEPATAGGSGGAGRTMSFKFTIVTDSRTVSSSMSRAPGVWEEEAANIAERILSASDIRVLFFSQSGLLIKSVAPSSVDYSNPATDNDGYYTLSVTFADEYFDKFDDDAVVPFTVMIIANLKGIGSDYLEYPAETTRVADVADSFVMAPTWFPSESSGIPMYGIKSFSVSKSTLLQGDDAPVAGTVDLIRSLCKIEVTDGIANATTAADGLKYPRVLSVDMISWNPNGYIRPKFDDYSELKEANIYNAAPGVPVQPVNAAAIADGNFRFYCPEAEVGNMRFRVTAVLAPGEAPQTFETVLDEFAAQIGNELVRNHIYRFNVHALSTVADLTVTVSDWNVKTDNFELDNIVSVEPDGFLTWDYDPADFAVTTETYNGNNEQQLSMLNSTSGYATGRFHIISPKGAIWKAYFIPGENGVDAFEFVDVDAGGNVIPGSESVFVEGEVGQPATLRIRGKGPADSYRHWAELVVEVKTADGNTLYAPLTPAMSSRFIVYRENRL